MRKAEQFAVDFEVHWNQLESLLVNFQDMTWLTPEENAKLGKFQSEGVKAEYEGLVKKISVLLASLTIVSIELTQKGEKR